MYYCREKYGSDISNGASRRRENMKRNYLHIEVGYNSLYVYVDGKRRGRLYTLKQLNQECLVLDDIAINKRNRIISLNIDNLFKDCIKNE